MTLVIIGKADQQHGIARLVRTEKLQALMQGVVHAHALTHGTGLFTHGADRLGALVGVCNKALGEHGPVGKDTIGHRLAFRGLFRHERYRVNDLSNIVILLDSVGFHQHQQTARIFLVGTHNLQPGLVHSGLQIVGLEGKNVDPQLWIEGIYDYVAGAILCERKRREKNKANQESWAHIATFVPGTDPRGNWWSAASTLIYTRNVKMLLKLFRMAAGHPPRANYTTDDAL